MFKQLIGIAALAFSFTAAAQQHQDDHQKRRVSR